MKFNQNPKLCKIFGHKYAQISYPCIRCGLNMQYDKNIFKNPYLGRPDILHFKKPKPKYFTSYKEYSIAVKRYKEIKECG